MPFIVFEGLDGSGKSTLLREIETLLGKKGISYVSTREPGGTPLAEDIRKILLKTEGETPTPVTEMMLYSAARAQHVDTVIRPALRKKQWVLSDRFAFSTYAFQVSARGLDPKIYESLTNAAVGDAWPDLWILVDLPIEVALGRMRASRGELDRMESEKSEFHQKVRDGYLELAKKSKIPVLILDGQKSVSELTAILVETLTKKGWLS